MNRVVWSTNRGTRTTHQYESVQFTPMLATMSPNYKLLYLLLLCLCLASTLEERWNSQQLQGKQSDGVHPDPHDTATQTHSDAHSFQGGSVVKTTGELCLSGTNVIQRNVKNIWKNNTLSRNISHLHYNNIKCRKGAKTATLSVMFKLPANFTIYIKDVVCEKGC